MNAQMTKCPMCRICRWRDAYQCLYGGPFEETKVWRVLDNKEFFSAENIVSAASLDERTNKGQ